MTEPNKKVNPNIIQTITAEEAGTTTVNSEELPKLNDIEIQMYKLFFMEIETDEGQADEQDKNTENSKSDELGMQK